MPQFFVGTTDVNADVGCIQSWDGIFSEGAFRGDLIELDWVDGAEWLPGPKKAYSFDVPIIIDGGSLDLSFSLFATVKGWHTNSTLTLTRTYTVGATSVSEECSAVMVSELSPVIIGGRAIKVVAIFQNLDGEWTAVTP